jgi:hypothetical protein
MRQRTFYVDDEKIVIKTRAKSYMNNPNGYTVNINGVRFNAFNFITRNEAEDWAYAKWVMENSTN